MDVQKILEHIIVSFKNNVRVINKATNHYTSYKDENGNIRLDKRGKPIKGITSQKSNAAWWSVRKPLHKETVFGKVSLRKTKDVRLSAALQDTNAIVDKDIKNEIKRLISLGYDEKRIRKYFTEGENREIWSEFNPNKIKVYYFTDDTFATRKSLDETFDKKRIETAVTDTGIQKILLKHLENNMNDPKVAFSPDGIERMNASMEKLNDGKQHMPIYKVRVYEAANKYAVGSVGNKKDKYVEAAKGTNLYFAIYVDDKGKRQFETISLNEVIERLKKKLSPVPEVNVNNARLLFWISPNDLIYVPTDEETKNDCTDDLNKDHIFKIVSFTNKRLYGIPYSVSKSIVDKAEFTVLNKIEFTFEKERCIPLKVDRLGNITYIGLEYLPKDLQQ